MNHQPPEEVPEGLSAREYQRLIALYTLMGRHNHAAKAFSRLSQCSDGLSMQGMGMSSRDADAGSAVDQLPDSAAAGENGEKAAKAKDSEADGANFAQALMQLLQQLTREEVANSEKDGLIIDDNDRAEIYDGKKGEADSNSDPLQAMKDQLLTIGLSEVEAQEYVQKLRRALTDRTHPEPPPRELPESLSAEEYWQLAVRYKQVGWTEQARDALTAAIEIDGDGPVGTKARCFLRSKIPRYPVPLMAEQLNIQGYNQMFVNEDESQRMFERLVSEYPDFEWPYGNLGSLLIKKGLLDKAQDLLIKAVQINAFYINGWLHLSRVYAIQGDFRAAEDCLHRVTTIDESDPNWKGIRDLVEQLKNDFGNGE